MLSTQGEWVEHGAPSKWPCMKGKSTMSSIVNWLNQSKSSLPLPNQLKQLVKSGRTLLFASDRLHLWAYWGWARFIMLTEIPSVHQVKHLKPSLSSCSHISTCWNHLKPFKTCWNHPSAASDIPWGRYCSFDPGLAECFQHRQLVAGDETLQKPCLHRAIFSVPKSVWSIAFETTAGDTMRYLDS